MIVMIVRRIYLVSRDSRAVTSIDQLRFTMRVLIESGFLYLATAIAHFVVWWTPNAFAISVISGIVSILLHFTRLLMLNGDVPLEPLCHRYSFQPYSH